MPRWPAAQSPPWWTLAQMLVWILRQVEIPLQDAEQFCNELNPKIIEETLDALTRALFDAICGAVEGMPIVAARIRCGPRYEDLAAFFQPLPSQPNALDALRYDLRQRIRQPDVEFSPVWGKRSWPARVPAATRPAESAEPIPAAEPGPEESQPPNKPDLVDAPMPAGPAGIINIGHDPAIAHALVHAIQRARPARPAEPEPAPPTESSRVEPGRDAGAADVPVQGTQIKPGGPQLPLAASEPARAADVGDQARAGPDTKPEAADELLAASPAHASSAAASPSPPVPEPPPRPPTDAPEIEHVAWAVQFLRITDPDKLVGLRGKKLQKLVCKTVGSNFSCSLRTFQRGKKRADSM